MNAVGGDAQAGYWPGTFFESLPCPAWLVQRGDWQLAHGNARGAAMVDGLARCSVADIDSCFEFPGAGEASVRGLIASAFGAGEQARLPARLRRSPAHAVTLVCWPLPGDGEISAVALMALEESATPPAGSHEGWWMRVGHDLRGPINPMRMAVQMLKAGRVPAAEQLEAVRLIDRQLDVLLEGVQDLSDLLRAEAGALGMSARPNDLNLIVDLVSGRGSLLRSFEERCQQLLCIGTPGELVVDHDPARLASLLEFLLRKASGHAADGASLTLSLVDDGHSARFAISGADASLLMDADLALLSGDGGGAEAGVKAVLMQRIASASQARLLFENEPVGLCLVLAKG
jgi:hypothetical protein